MWTLQNWWRCARCNFAHFEQEAPHECPVCRGGQFVKVILAPEVTEDRYHDPAHVTDPISAE